MVDEVYLNKAVTKKKTYGFYLKCTQQLPDFSPMHLSLIFHTCLEGLLVQGVSGPGAAQTAAAPSAPPPASVEAGALC